MLGFQVRGNLPTPSWAPAPQLVTMTLPNPLSAGPCHPHWAPPSPPPPALPSSSLPRSQNETWRLRDKFILPAPHKSHFHVKHLSITLLLGDRWPGKAKSEEWDLPSAKWGCHARDAGRRELLCSVTERAGPGDGLLLSIRDAHLAAWEGGTRPRPAYGAAQQPSEPCLRYSSSYFKSPQPALSLCLQSEVSWALKSLQLLPVGPDSESFWQQGLLRARSLSHLEGVGDLNYSEAHAMWALKALGIVVPWTWTQRLVSFFGRSVYWL